MIQTRYMKKNNITMSDIQTRDFHIENYETIKRLKTPSPWKTFIVQSAKEKLNYIINSYRREIDLGPFYYQFRGQPHRYITRTISDSVDTGSVIRNCPVNLIICRYENKRDHIKQEVLKECKACGDAW